MTKRSFRQLVQSMPQARQQKIEKRFQESLAAMSLDELRRLREMTQIQLGQVLEVHQSEVSKIEHRTDICVSTLVEYVEALGGRLELRAVFPDHEVRISQFDESRR